MKIIYAVRQSIAVICLSLVLFSVSGRVAYSQENNEAVSGESSTNAGSVDLSKEEMKKIEEARMQAERAAAQAEAVKKEAEIRQKELELEKRKAEVKAKEARAAKQEAEMIRTTTEDGTVVRKALDEAAQKEEEARISREKVAVHEEELAALREKVVLAEEELALAREMTSQAETKLRAWQRVLYGKAISTLAILIMGYLLLFILISAANRKIEDLKFRHSVRKNLIYLVNMLMAIGIFLVWSRNMQSVTIFVSAMGAGVALALHESILCIAGWLFILFRRPFDTGDRIEFGGVKGDVIDIQIFHTSLLEIGNWAGSDQSTGRIVKVPNSSVFKEPTYNYNRGFEFIWNEIKIVVTFESDWEKAKAILMKHGEAEARGMEEIVRKKIKSMSRSYMIYYDNLQPAVYVDIKDSGIELILRYLTEVKRRRVTQDDICMNILKDFDGEENVNFAYNTYRVVRE